MNVVIYANSSYYMGTGHVMRCLTLVDYFKTQGAHITFMTDISLAGNISNLITEKGYKIIEPLLENIPQNTDWLIIDNYDIDQVFESQARQYTKNIMVIDDLADRPHDCDLLLDQNLYINAESRYRDLVPKDCTLLLEPKYALLRDEFLQERTGLKLKDGVVKRIFVNFGGTDPADMTSKTLYILKNYNIETDIVVGQNSIQLEKLKQLCASIAHFNLHIQTTNIAKLMAGADLAIAAGGSSTWERCCLGLPTIVVAIADNQVELSETLAEKEMCFYAGFHNDKAISESLIKLMNYCINNSDVLKRCSKKIMALSDGRGKEEVWKMLQTDQYSFRFVEKNDCNLMFNWRNADNVRLMLFHSDKTPYENHVTWFNKMLIDEDRKYFIFEINKAPVGIVNFSNFNKEDKSAEWGFYIGKTELPKGTGTRMCELGVDLAKNYLNLKNIYALILVTNAKSISIHEKLLFKKLGESENPQGKSYFTYKLELK